MYSTLAFSETPLLLDCRPKFFSPGLQGDENGLSIGVTVIFESSMI